MPDIERAYRLGFLEAANMLSVWKDGRRTVGTMGEPYWKLVLEGDPTFYDPPVCIEEIEDKLETIEADAVNSKARSEK